MWAKAICIDQSNFSKLAQQVSIKRLIYRNAKKVLVWLGKDIHGDAHEAFALVCTIFKYWRLPPTTKIRDGFAEHNDKITFAKEGELDGLTTGSVSVWDFLTILYCLPWFE